MSNPYDKHIEEARQILRDLMKRATDEEDMKVFKNIAAVYIVWQHELHQLELAAMAWEIDMKNKVKPKRKWWRKLLGL